MWYVIKRVREIFGSDLIAFDIAMSEKEEKDKEESKDDEDESSDNKDKDEGED